MKNKKKKILIYQLIKFRKMKNEKIIEVNLGVGTDQLFPEIIKILIEDDSVNEEKKTVKKSKKTKEEKLK